MSVPFIPAASDVLKTTATFDVNPSSNTALKSISYGEGAEFRPTGKKPIMLKKNKDYKIILDLESKTLTVKQIVHSERIVHQSKYIISKKGDDEEARQN